MTYTVGARFVGMWDEFCARARVDAVACEDYAPTPVCSALGRVRICITIGCDVDMRYCDAYTLERVYAGFVRHIMDGTNPAKTSTN